MFLRRPVEEPGQYCALILTAYVFTKERSHKAENLEMETSTK